MNLPSKRLYELFPDVKTKTHLTKPQILVKILQLILVRLVDKMSFPTAMQALNLPSIKTFAQLNCRNSWKTGEDPSKKTLMIERVNTLRNLILRQQSPSLPVPPPSNTSQGTVNTL